MAAELEPFIALDEAIARVGGSMRVLKHLAWPEGQKRRFLTSWRSGRPVLPDVAFEPVAYDGPIRELETLMESCDRGHPIGNHLWKTAWSYATVGRMLGAIGTPMFTDYSAALYGRPDIVYERQGLSAIHAADSIMAVTSDLVTGDVVAKADTTITAEAFAARLRAALNDFFTDDPVEVVVSSGMSAKAAAASKRVRLREGAMFSELDFAQLLNHEALTHTLTSINGKRQPLRALGLGSPRTTRTQEGLAVFSELVTFAIDIGRLRRVALRSQAVHLALSGADFIEVFEHFLAAGQTESESYHSAQRIFRGGDVRGSVAFTKDGAYLEGLVLVQTFLRKAIAVGREELIPLIFAGRLTLGDTIELEEFFTNGVLAPARYIPPWAQGLRQLAANLAYSLFMGRIQMDLVDLGRFIDLDEPDSAQSSSVYA